MRTAACLLVQLYSYVLFARVIISFAFLFSPDWRPPSFVRPVIQFIYALTEPPLRFIRKYVPQPASFPLDISFIILAVIVGMILPRVLCA